MPDDFAGDAAQIRYLVSRYGLPAGLRALVRVGPGLFVTAPIPSVRVARTSDRGWLVIGRQTRLAGDLDAANALASEPTA